MFCCFTLNAFNIFFFVFNFCQFDYSVSQHVTPWVDPEWYSLHFVDLGDCFLSHVREVFSYYLLKYLLRPSVSLPSGIPIMQMLVHLMLYQRSLRFPHFFSFFILFQGSYFHHSVFQLTYLFFSLMLLILSSVFFIAVIVFFNSDWLFFIFYNSLLKTSYNFLLCASILFLNY